ncbi:MAG: DUF3048 domain-containing protein [Chloroflexi bacterium]|nr:DUF3048 domain-containing protein [Chloroflexota bacterium]
MKKRFVFLVVLILLMSACSRAPADLPAPTDVPPTNTPFPPQPTSTVTTVPPTATLTPTPSASPTPAYPLQGRGPDNFEAGVNPLTGLEVDDPQLLERRPILIKVENIPREHRPQWGLSLADIVYEYYTEFGATRFAALFYGNNADQVGPIRSGRFFDSNVIQMYKSIMVYGSAYVDVRTRFYNSDFANRLILETTTSCPAVCRADPNGQNLLVSNTAALMDYVRSRGIDNTRQNLDGMFFQLTPPQGGSETDQVYIRYSGAIYNRWDYDPATGRYLRFADAQNDINRSNEVYQQLTDRLTNEPVAAENVVALCVPHQYYVKNSESEVLEIIMDNQVPSYTGCDGEIYQGGTGPAYIARDGKIYKVIWKRAAKDSVLTLVNPDGSLFPFKPGQTWFEVIGASSSVEQQSDGAWRFTHRMVP